MLKKVKAAMQVLNEKFPHRYIQMRDTVLPYLANTFDDINALQNSISSMTLLKNMNSLVGLASV